jgi:hypothetical protein
MMFVIRCIALADIASRESELMRFAQDRVNALHDNAGEQAVNGVRASHLLET